VSRINSHANIKRNEDKFAWLYPISTNPTRKNAVRALIDILIFIVLVMLLNPGPAYSSLKGVFAISLIVLCTLLTFFEFAVQQPVRYWRPATGKVLATLAAMVVAIIIYCSERYFSIVPTFFWIQTALIISIVAAVALGLFVYSVSNVKFAVLTSLFSVPLFSLFTENTGPYIETLYLTEVKIVSAKVTGVKERVWWSTGRFTCSERLHLSGTEEPWSGSLCLDQKYFPSLPAGSEVKIHLLRGTLGERIVWLDVVESPEDQKKR